MTAHGAQTSSTAIGYCVFLDESRTDYVTWHIPLVVCERKIPPFYSNFLVIRNDRNAQLTR
jgi:hypothetical protein